MWIAEEVPADPEAPNARPARTIQIHRDRRSAAKAMANWLYYVGRHAGRTGRQASLDGYYRAAGDLFAASASCPAAFTPELRVNDRLYRLRQNTDTD